MNITSVYPVLLTDQVAPTAAFYRDHFGFQDAFVADWYVSLHVPGNPAQELAILAVDHPTVPAGHRTAGAGVIVNVEVQDATAAYERLVQDAGLTVARELRDEAFGQRHFIVQDPAGNLVDVIQNIEVGADYVENYS